MKCHLQARHVFVYTVYERDVQIYPSHTEVLCTHRALGFLQRYTWYAFTKHAVCDV